MYLFLNLLIWRVEQTEIQKRKKKKKKKHGTYILILRVYKELNGISK